MAQDNSSDTKSSTSIKDRYSELLKRYQVSFHVGRFKEGYKGYQEIAIPNYTADISVERMQGIFIDQKNQFSPEILGALSRRIELAEQKEKKASVLKVMGVIAEDFRKQHSIYQHFFPQDFYFPLIDKRNTGRCCPLVRAMAVALSKGNEEGRTAIHAFSKKIVLAAASPEANDTKLLVSALHTLHSNLDIAKTSVEPNFLTLDGIIAKLSQAQDTTTYALNTPVHAMMVAVVNNGEQRIYSFYDPNFGIVSYNNSHSLKEALKQHFIKRQLGMHYEAWGTANHPTFSLQKINVEAIEKVALGENLIVRDLIASETLSKISAGRHQSLISNQRGHATVPDSNAKLGASLKLSALLSKHGHTHIADTLNEIEGLQWIKRCFNAIKKINLDKKNIPLFSKVETNTDGTFLISYIDADQKIKSIVTTDSSFLKLKQYLANKTKVLNQKSRLPSIQFTSLNKNISDVISVLLLARQATYLLRDIPEAQESEQLYYALTMHITINRLQLIQGGLQTTESILQTTCRVLKIATPQFLKKNSTLFRLAKLPTRSLPVIGTILDIADTSLTIYELAHAEDHSRRVIYGAQIVLNTANLAVNTATVTAIVTGATTIATSLSFVAVPLIVVSVGINLSMSLYIKYVEIRDGFNAVRQYCDHITQSYAQGGYELTQNLLLQPFDGIPIEAFDLQKGSIRFGKQYLHRSQQTLPEKIERPGMLPDYIEIRSTLGHAIEASLPSAWRHTKYFILPSVPNHKMYYVYTSTVKSFSPIKDNESQLIRDSNDDWFPTTRTYSKSSGKSTTKHYVVTELVTEYLATTITITLDNQARYLHMPASTAQRLSKLTYEFQGAGGEYYLNLQPGTNVSLSEQKGTSSSSWVIDASLWQSPYKKMAIFNDKIKFDSQTLFINADKIKKLLIYDVNKTLGEVDFKTKSIRLMKIDFIEWEKQKLSNDLLSYLKTLPEHQMPESYLVIEHYPAHRRFIQNTWQEDVARTRAFYDVRHQRILYTYHQELSLLKDSFVGYTYHSYEAIIRETLEYIAHTEEISNRFSNIDKRWHDFLDLFLKHPLHELVQQFQQRTDLAFMPLMKRFIYILQQTSMIEPEQEEIFYLKRYSSQDSSAHFPHDQDEVYTLDDEQNKLPYANQIKIISIEEKKTARRFQYLLKWLKRVTQKTDSLNTISLQIKEAELAGVIGNHVYFYNKEKSTAWRTDLATGYQQIIFHFLFDTPLIKAWEENGAIQVEQKWTLANGQTGYLRYSIKNDQISLTSITGDQAFLSALLNAQQDLQRFQQALNKQSSRAPAPYTLAISMSSDITDALYWFKAGDTVKKDASTDCVIYPAARSTPVTCHTSIVPIFNQAGQSVALQYWIRVTDNLIIKPNLSSLAESSSSFSVPEDLAYVGSIAQSNQAEIFYFYSAQEKIIYRQEGPGYTHLNHENPITLCIPIPGLTHFFQHSDRFIALTAEGLVLEIDALGQSHLLSVNKQWLEKQTTPWWLAVQNLAEERKEISFNIEGLTGINPDNTLLNQNVQLAAWYDSGYVIVVDNALRGKKLTLVYTDQQGRFAYLLDTSDGKLYKQLIPQEHTLVSAFGNDHILNAANALPSAAHVATKLAFKSAHTYAHNIRLVTHKGEIFLLNHEEKLSLIGVDQQWQSNLSDKELIQACDELTTVAKQNSWLSEDVLVLQVPLNQTPRWYDHKHKRIIEAQGLTGADLPEWIGVEADSNIAYIFSSVKQAIYKINGTQTTHLLNASAVKKPNQNQLLVVGTHDADTLVIPRMTGIDQVIYSGGIGTDTYTIDLASWQHYSKILIHNFDANPIPDQDNLHLSVENQEHLIVYQDNNDLAFLDIANNRSVNISDAFGQDNGAYRHMNIKLYQSGEIFLEQSIDALIQELSRFSATSMGSTNPPFASPLALFPPMINTSAIPSIS